MPADVWVVIEQSAPAAAMRGSIWLYPLVNVIHILGLMAFFSAVVAMDVRLLGRFSRIPLAMIVRPCRRTAAAALIVQAISGALLFSSEATTIAGNDAFIAKMLMLTLALANAVGVFVLWERVLETLPAGAPVPPAVRLAAGISLGAWVSVAILGRLIAYM
jgi:hypothetical protein